MAGIYPGIPAATLPLTGNEVCAFDTGYTAGRGPATIDVSIAQLASAGLTSAPTQANLTALAGGGRPNATALRIGLNRVTTVATAADSVVLPSATAGSIAF